MPSSRTRLDARLEEVASAALERRRGRASISAPPSAGKLAANLLRPLLPDSAIGLSDLKRRWVDIVGERLSGLTEPEKLHGGTLTVRSHASAAPFVQHQARLIIERANLAGAAVNALQIRQGSIPPKAQPNVRALTRPLTADEEAAIAKTLADIEHAPLKAALMRLGRAVASK